MKKSLAILSLVLATTLPPVASGAQDLEPVATAVPSVHILTQAERDSAKRSVLGALSAEHRAKVLAIVKRVNTGRLTDFRAAERQIDAILSPEEVQAVLSEREKTLRGGDQNNESTPHAGRFLLRLAISAEKLRELRLQFQKKH